jgi:hypothetical protein
MDVLTLLVMVIQFGIGFLVKRMGPDKAKLLVPTVTTITSLIYQVGLAFAASAGAPPANVGMASSGVILAGFFGTLGNVFLDAIVNTLFQTALVTGAHSAPKNFIQGVKSLSK